MFVSSSVFDRERVDPRFRDVEVLRHAACGVADRHVGRTGVECRYDHLVGHVDVEAPVLATIYERFIAAIRGEGVADPDFARGAALQRMLDRAEQSAAQHGLSLNV